MTDDFAAPPLGPIGRALPFGTAALRGTAFPDRTTLGEAVLTDSRTLEDERRGGEPLEPKFPPAPASTTRHPRLSAN